MAWERRKPGRYYFYRSRRVGGRVVKDYFGKGAVGQLAADLAEEGRARRAEDAAALCAEQARLEALDRAPKALGRAATVLVEAALVVGGYRRFNYGPWRRRRDGARTVGGAGRPRPR
jgi:hypothetical protein